MQKENQTSSHESGIENRYCACQFYNHVFRHNHKKNFAMKHVAKYLKFICLVIVCSVFISSCHKVETVQVPVNTGSSSPGADSLSGHLQFINAKKYKVLFPQAHRQVL